MRMFFRTLAVCLFVGRPAAAQVERPPVELGLGFGAVAGGGFGEIGVPSQPPVWAFRATVPFSGRFSIEGTWSPPRNPVSPYRVNYWDYYSYYTIQVKQRLVRGSRRGFHPFVTYGGAGAYCPRELWLPGIAAVGLGMEQRLGSHAGVRADLQFLTVIGVRMAADISIPLGRYRRQ